MTSRRWLGSLVAVAVAVAIAAVAAVDSGHLGASDPSAVTIALTAPPGTPVLRVGGPRRGRAVPSGFIGLSIEFSALPAYAGRGGDVVDPVFAQLIRNLAPGQRPVLRIGGDSTDRTWVAVRGMPRPAGVTYTIGRSWLQTADAVTDALNARVVAGINFEANSSRLASTEARALLAAVGRSSLQALELGNEPELYGTFPWYHVDGHGVTGRPAGWDVPAYIADFSRIARSLPRVALAAPATGAAGWMLRLGQVATAEPRVGVATVHRYPLQRCFTANSSPQYPTIPHLLSTASSAGLANSVAGFVAVAHAHGLPVRVDEFNSVSCSGKRGVSDTFASALWALDATFQMARVGVDGVNIHTFPGGIYQPFKLRRAPRGWLGFVEPAYYGLMMFAQAAPAGSRLLALAGSPAAGVRAWATRAPDRTIRVVLINNSLHRPRYVALRIPGNFGPAALERLRAPSVGTNTGVTLGGRSFGPKTKTGLLTGRKQNYVVAQVNGKYVLRLPAASAAMLTLTPSR